MSDAMRPEVTTLVEASRDLQLRSLDAGLLSVDGTLALEVRDVLAEVDKEGLSLALAEVLRRHLFEKHSRRLHDGHHGDGARGVSRTMGIIRQASG